MKKAENLSFRKWDLCAIAAVLLLGVVVFMAFLPQNSGETAVIQIYQNGKLIHETALSEDRSIAVEGEYCNTVAIRGGKVYMEESSCPGRDCVHSGSISQPGRSIVCLPNRVEVRITGQSDIDAVVR